MSAALQPMLERVLALPACTGEPAAIFRAYLAGDRSAIRARLRPEIRTARTAPQLAMWWAEFAIVHALLDDAQGLEVAIRGIEDALVLAAASGVPPTRRIGTRESERPTDPCPAPTAELEGGA